MAGTAPPQEKRKKKPSRLRTFFKRAAIAGAGLAVLGSIEYTGYSWFDGKDGSNILCDMDPTCRTLTDGERAMAKTFFGDKIDYDRIKIFNRPWLGIPFKAHYTDVDINISPPGFIPPRSPWESGHIKLPTFITLNKHVITNDKARTPNGHIYFRSDCYSDDFSKTTNTNCYNGMNNPLAKHRGLLMHEITHSYQHKTISGIASRLFSDLKAHDYDYGSLYDYDIDDVNEYSTLTLEQQAQIVGDFMELLEGYHANPKIEHGNKLMKYAEILAPHFPGVGSLMAAAGLDSQTPGQPDNMIRKTIKTTAPLNTPAP